MAKCNIADPCVLEGWPQLNGLCPDHFRIEHVQPAMLTMDEAVRHWAELCDKVYHVEVAQGLRPAIMRASATRIATTIVRNAAKTKNHVLLAGDLDSDY